MGKDNFHGRVKDIGPSIPKFRIHCVLIHEFMPPIRTKRLLNKFNVMLKVFMIFKRKGKRKSGYNQQCLLKIKFI